MYEEELKSLGLTDNEVKIYLVLLEKGMLNPYKIAEITGLHRGYIYDALERMQEKGVVNTVIHQKKKHYQVTSPENLVELLRMRMEDFQKIVPDMTKIMASSKEETRVELFKGRDVIKIMIKDLMATVKKGGQLYGIFESEAPFLTLEPIYMKKYFKYEQDNNITEKSIIREGGKKFNYPHIEYRTLPPKYIGQAFNLIYGNKVANIIWGNPNYMIIVENKQYVDTCKKQFELLWKTAR